MIFDEYNEGPPGKTIPDKPAKAAEFETSLDNYWQERKHKIEKKDFSDVYQKYKVAINENFFKKNRETLISEAKVMTRAQRKIKKQAGLVDRTGVINNRGASFKSVRENQVSMNALPTVEEEEPLDKFTSSIHNLDQVEARRSRLPRRKMRSMASRVEVGKLVSKCSFRELKTFVNFNDLERVKAFTTADFGEIANAEPEKMSTLKSLESLDAPAARKPSKPKVEGEKCPICHKKFILKSEIAITNACNHVFHEDCLKEAVAINWNPDVIKCPKCSATL